MAKTNQPKKATPAVVSRVLAAADFDRSVGSASMIRGMKNYSRGFVAEKRFKDGATIVRHRASMYFVSQGERDKWLTRYSAALADHFTVTVDADDNCLVITEKPVAS